jgi:ATP-binding cassette subfamily E protein 1
MFFSCVCCLYGEPGAYGVVAPRSNVNHGINEYLAGYIKIDNVRFRSEPLEFPPAFGLLFDDDAPEERDVTYKSIGRKKGDEEEEAAKWDPIEYPVLSKTLHAKDGSESSFTLTAEAGVIRPGEVIALMGQNGCGKTTFLRMLYQYWASGKEGCAAKALPVSFKRQHPRC